MIESNGASEEVFQQTVGVADRARDKPFRIVIVDEIVQERRKVEGQTKGFCGVGYGRQCISCIAIAGLPEIIGPLSGFFRIARVLDL